MSRGGSAVRRGLVVGLLLCATAAGASQLVGSTGGASAALFVPPPRVEQLVAFPAPPDTGVPSGPDELLWSADFESGDLSAFEETPWNQVGSGPPLVLTLADGTRALALTIPPGGARNEVVPDFSTLREGDDLHFGFSTFLVPGFPVDAGWQVLTQWKNDGTGSPPISLSVEQGRFVLDGGWGHPGGHRFHYQRDLGPAVAGVWHRWVFHIRFSEDPTSGFAQVWRDGRQVLARFSPPGGTLYPDLNSYLKTGYYRDERIGVAGTVVLDDWRIGTTYAAVSGTAPDPRAPDPRAPDPRAPDPREPGLTPPRLTPPAAPTTQPPTPPVVTAPPPTGGVEPSPAAVAPGTATPPPTTTPAPAPAQAGPPRAAPVPPTASPTAPPPSAPAAGPQPSEQAAGSGPDAAASAP